MSLIAGCARRHVWKIPRLRYIRQPSWTSQASFRTSRASYRCFHNGAETLEVEEGERDRFWEEYKLSFTVPRPNFKLSKQISRNLIGKEVVTVGSLGKRKDMNTKMSFADFFGEGGSQKVQLCSRSEISQEAFKTLRAIPPESAVCITGVLNLKREPKTQKKPREIVTQLEEGMVFLDQVEIQVQSITCLNRFPREFQIKPDGTERHLQIRFDPTLKERLHFRSKVAAFARRELEEFTEIETPILFKSTPEGAREFIVPTRTRGYAYSLPQSPQQYKQLLMASGIHRYMQFARCFRDEDHRADRQPEFTQIDLEMAWADGEDVMYRVEQLMKALWREFSTSTPVPTFDRMGYHEAMSKHGSDKPDLRIPGLIHRIDRIVPEDLSSMLTSIKKPTIEAWKIRLNGDLNSLKKFISAFMDSPDAAEFRTNPDGAPGVFLFNPAAPLEGLNAFGFEAAGQLRSLYNDAAASPAVAESRFDEGDILLVQAREDAPHSGGSTMLGKLRRAIFQAAVKSELVELDPMDRFLWVTDFPMFTLNSGDEPGQEGNSGFSATHHPFTAPKSADDVDLLLTDPLSAIADHYDLVLNGVELGGGSRRIHNAEMQQFIMKDILKMDPQRMDSFSHLFRALQAGCPPHAGLAIGFDRLIAVMTGRSSVRDVIAFPKDKMGKDLLVKSPGPIVDRQLLHYHMQVIMPQQLTTETETPED